MAELPIGLRSDGGVEGCIVGASLWWVLLSRARSHQNPNSDALSPFYISTTAAFLRFRTPSVRRAILKYIRSLSPLANARADRPVAHSGARPEPVPERRSCGSRGGCIQVPRHARSRLGARRRELSKADESARERHRRRACAGAKVFAEGQGTDACGNGDGHALDGRAGRPDEF